MLFNIGFQNFSELKKKFILLVFVKLIFVFCGAFTGSKSIFKLIRLSSTELQKMDHSNGVEQYSDNPDLNGKIRDWLKWDKVRWFLVISTLNKLKSNNVFTLE